MKLSDFELDVMQHFWDMEPKSAPEIHEVIAEKRKVSYSTVKTIIDRLEQKGVLTRVRQIGRVIFYRPAIDKDAVSKSVIPDLIKYLFQGKPQNLVTHVLQDENLNADDISQLKRLIEKLEAKQKG